MKNEMTRKETNLDGRMVNSRRRVKRTEGEMEEKMNGRWRTVPALGIQFDVHRVVRVSYGF